MKIYTGVGSRKTPLNILKIMTAVAKKLSSAGYILRSGGADGADSAFESGASKRQIFYAKDATPESMRIAEKFHPAWNRCSTFARRLHARNAFQVLGADLKTPSQFLICWTPDGAISHKDRSILTGGTGTAISIADYYKVRVYNLKRPDHLQKIVDYLNK